MRLFALGGKVHRADVAAEEGEKRDVGIRVNEQVEPERARQDEQDPERKLDKPHATAVRVTLCGGVVADELIVAEENDPHAAHGEK